MPNTSYLHAIKCHIINANKTEFHRHGAAASKQAEVFEVWLSSPIGAWRRALSANWCIIDNIIIIIIEASHSSRLRRRRCWTSFQKLLIAVCVTKFRLLLSVCLRGWASRNELVYRWFSTSWISEKMCAFSRNDKC